jgi:hypothetical protein
MAVGTRQTIPPAILELLQAGVSVNIGTRNAACRPECTRGWGIRVAKDRTTVTLLLTEASSQQTLANLRDNGVVAVTCSRPTDHVTCQIKGTVQRIRQADQPDREMQRRWRRAFLDELLAVGVPAEQADGLIMEPALAVDIAVTDVFAQTPGPGAGEKV